MGADKFTAHGKAAFDLLSDGRWHDIVDVVHHIGHFIPHGRAIRAWEDDHPNPRGTVTTDLKVLAGRRRIARSIVGNQVRSGAWERSGDLVRLSNRSTPS